MTEQQEIALLAAWVSTTEGADTDNPFCGDPGCPAQEQMDREGMDVALALAENAYIEGWRIDPDPDRGDPLCPKHVAAFLVAEPVS